MTNLDVERIITYHLPGNAPPFSLKLSSSPHAQPTFAEIRQLLEMREAPPSFFLALQEPTTQRWYQEADFEGGVIPLWEPLLLNIVEKEGKLERVGGKKLEDIMPFSSMQTTNQIKHKLWFRVEAIKRCIFTVDICEGPHLGKMTTRTGDALVSHYDDQPLFDTGIAFMPWFLRAAFPRALNLYLVQKLPMHTAFIDSLARMVDACDRDDDRDNDKDKHKDCHQDWDWEDEIPWKKWKHTLVHAIEGCIRLKLANTDDVDATNACHEFIVWFNETLIPDAMELWVKSVKSLK